VPELALGRALIGDTGDVDEHRARLFRHEPTLPCCNVRRPSSRGRPLRSLHHSCPRPDHTAVIPASSTPGPEPSKYLASTPNAIVRPRASQHRTWLIIPT
jgi:hypothetical protein